MARINTYDQPAQAQFINTYVPIPFQEMMAAGQMKQERYDKAAGATDAMIGALDEIVAIPNSRDELRAKEYADKMRNIRDKYITRDLSDPFVQRELSNEINRNINKQDIRHIQESYQGYLNYNKMLSQFELEGRPTPAWARQRFEGYDSTRSGVFTGNPEAYKDPLAATQEFLNNLKPDFIGSREETVNGVKTGRIFSMSGITTNRIKDHVNKNIDAFMSLPAIQQMVRGAMANGDTRDPKDIVLDYVQSHAPEWSYTNADNYAFRPSYMSGTSGGGFNGEGEDTELIVEDAVDKDARKLRSRQITKLEEKADKAASSGDINAMNVANQYRAAREAAENNPELISKIDDIKNNRIPEITNSAINALKEQGLSEEEALEYLNIDGVGDAVATGYKSIYGVAGNIRDRFHNFTDVIGKKLSTDLVGFNTALAGTILRNKKLVDLGVKIADTGNLELEERRGNRGSRDAKSQILIDYYKNLNKASKDLNSISKEQKQAGDQAINAILGHQDTYTAMETMFEYDNGILKETFYDDNNTKKFRDSFFAKNISNMFHNIGDYQANFYNDEGVLSKRSLKELQTKFNTADRVSIIGVDNIPEEDGGVSIRMRMYSKDKDGKSTNSGEDFRVKMPARNEEDRKKILANLYKRNQTQTADVLGNYNFVNARVKSLDLYNGENTIPLTDFDPSASADDNIIIEQVGYKFLPYIVIDGIKTPMYNQPVTYGLNGETISTIILDYLRRKRKDY